MPRKVLLSILLLSLAAFCFIAQGRKGVTRIPAGEAARRANAARVGEKIRYDVKIGIARLGSAEFNHVAVTTLAGKPAHLITFKTKLANFDDLEKIYSDAESFLPLKVERSISMWPSKEEIVEDYDQQGFTLTVTKLKGKKESRQVFTGDGPIHNAVIFPYVIRNVPEPAPGWSVLARFAAQQFTIRLVGKEKVVVPAGTFNAWYFKSSPRKFEIWISADEQRIPLKIKGIGGYTLLMREYTPGTPAPQP